MVVVGFEVCFKVGKKGLDSWISSRGKVKVKVKVKVHLS